MLSCWSVGVAVSIDLEELMVGWGTPYVLLFVILETILLLMLMVVSALARWGHTAPSRMERDLVFEL